MAKKQINKEEIKKVKEEPKVIKEETKVNKAPKPTKKVKPVVVEKVKPLQLEDLMQEIKGYEKLLVTSLNEMESKQDLIDALNKIIVEKENDVVNLSQQLAETSSKLECLNSKVIEAEELKSNLSGLISYLKYYKRVISTNYGLTTVNIIFSLIMFAVFGISILASFGVKHLIGETGNISIVLISSFTSSAIGYFLYLVNWKK